MIKDKNDSSSPMGREQEFEFFSIKEKRNIYVSV